MLFSRLVKVWFPIVIFSTIISRELCAESGYLRFKKDFLHRLVAAVPGILESQDKKTGRFGSGVWIVNDQNSMFPLGAAWSIKDPHNPYYHSQRLLEAIMDAGDALIADQNPTGQWVFRKKDGSTWGDTYMCWVYSRWIRTFNLIKDAMPPDRRKRWEDGLILGFTGISKTQLTRVQNIPCHQAMGLYIAGQTFNRDDWQRQAQDFLIKVCEAQSADGFWSENAGPVVSYNTVYCDALGVYYAVSRDKRVLPAIEKASFFHAMFTYPNGGLVETIDERNSYHSGIRIGTVASTYSAVGRGQVAKMLALKKKAKSAISNDDLAGFLLYGEEGPTEPIPAQGSDDRFIQSDGKAMTQRTGPWFVCLSAYINKISSSRWIQDRQNLVSIFHDKTGLILGGGNTKLQPLWSNFTVGDTALLQHKPGDTAPVFTPSGLLYHIPKAAALKITKPQGLSLRYGSERCGISVEPVDEKLLRIHLRSTVSSGQPVAAHLTLIPQMGKPLTTASGAQRIIDDKTFSLTSTETGGWISHNGWKLMLPDGASVSWPALPHNQYKKDGFALPAEGRIVVTLPFSQDHQEYSLNLEVK